MSRREFSIFIIFYDAYACSYVASKLLADSNQNWIFYEFLKLLKNWAKDPYYSTGSLAKFHQKWLRENSPFL